jgi:hypothetical protein
MSPVRGTLVGGCLTIAVVVASCGGSSTRGFSSHATTPTPREATSTTGSGLYATPTSVVVAKALPPGDVAHAIEVLQAIKAAGLGCGTAYLDVTHPAAAKEQVNCTVGDTVRGRLGVTIGITLYDNHDAMMRDLPSIACYGQILTPVHYIAGHNWGAFVEPMGPDADATALRVSAALHAPIRAVNC